MTTMDDNLNGLELLSGRLVTLFLTLAIAEESVKRFPAGTHVKVTNDPNPDLNGEYTWDGVKLVKTTNNTLEKAKEQAKEVAKDAVEDKLTTENILDLINGEIKGSHLDRRLEQRIDKIPSIVGNIEELKEEVTVIQDEVNVKVNQMTYDLYLINKDIENLHLEVDADFEAIKQLIDEKFVEVDDLRADLNKEVADRIQAVKDETDARIAEIRLLNDGLTQEIVDRKEGDKEVLAYVDNYKTSNDTAMANIRDEVKVAVDTSVASAQKVDAMDARVTSAENNATTALENSATAVTKVNALATDVNAVSERVDSLTADVVKAVDDSGKALTNSASAIESAKTAVDTANAVAEQVTVVQAKLNDKSTTYRETVEPTIATHPDLTKGDIWINQDKNNEQKRWDGTKWVDISDLRVGDNATAISKLTATVTEQGDTIQAQSSKITDLETNLGEKADASALESLKTTVTDQGGLIQTNTESITALQGSIAGKADAKALSDLQIVVTEQGDTISSQGQAITSVQNSLADKADSSTVSALTSTVTKQGEDITAQGKAITGLEQEVAGKASSQVVDELKSTVTQQGDDITAQGKSIEQIKTAVDGKADASALNALTTTVSEIDGKVSSQGQAITSLENSMAGKADASALTALETKVEEVDGRVTSQGQAIIAVENSLKDKADASAVNQLKSTVEQQGNTITSQGQAITKVEAKVDNIAIGSENFIDEAGVWSTEIATGGDVASLSSDLSVMYVWSGGTSNYVTGMLSGGKIPRLDANCNDDDDVIFSVEMLIESGSVPQAPSLYWKDSMNYMPLQLAKGQVQRYDVWQRYYHTRKYVKGYNVPHFSFPYQGVYRFRRPIFERGNIPTAWNVSDTDFATARAVQTLDAKVTTIGDKTDANAQAITDLRTSVNGKADSSALESLKSTVTEQGNTITSQGQAITSVTATATDTANRVGVTRNWSIYTFRNGNSLHEKRGLFNAKGEWVGGIGRGMNVYIFNRLGDLADWKNFDTYESLEAYRNMANAIGEIPYGNFFAIAGCDNIGDVGWSNEPQVVELRTALISCGFRLEDLRDWTGNRMPIAVTRRSAPAGSPICVMFNSEVFQDWFSHSFSLVDGTPVGFGANTQDRQNVLANSTAITKLDATVTQHGQDITAQAQSITGLQSSIAGKADANALSQLETKVNQQGDTITAQGTALTQVEAKSEMALNGKKTIVDLTSLDPNLYYPVFMNINSVGIAEIEIVMNLGTEQAPWSSHGGGSFAMSLRWSVKGSGWGAQDIDRQIINANWLWTASGQSPFQDINQQGEASREYVYLRGGTRYHFTCNQYVNGIPYYEGSGGAEYRPDLLPKSINSKLNATAQATSTLEATVNTIDGKVNANSQAITQVGTTVAGIPTGTGNLLKNPDFALGDYTGWETSSYNYPISGMLVKDGSPLYPVYAPDFKPSMALGLNATTNVTGWEGYMEISQKDVFVSAGKKYQASCYLQTHRCKGTLFVYFYDVNGNHIGNTFGNWGTNETVNTGQGSGKTLNDFTRHYVTFLTPPNCAKLTFVIRGHEAGDSPWLILTRSQVCELSLNANTDTAPVVAWQDSTTANTALVQQSLQSINGIRAEYTVKTDVNGYVAGIGLINEGAGKSQFIIRADMFAVANPASVGNDAKYAFVYRSTPLTLPNGTVIPAGLYVDNLMMPEVRAERIYADSIDAISAKLGRFETTVSGKGKTVITGSEFQVFDQNGQERIFLGIR